MSNVINTGNEKNSVISSNKSRYLQLLMLVIAGGAIFPMLYLRQIYQTTMLEAFNITNGQLGELYSILGLMFFLTYGPSGWLADKFRPMLLITISLIATGLLGLWYATLPSFNHLLFIYGAWGVTCGLTFWGAVMKRIRILSSDNETGRFYGIYDGGRGLVEAILAAIALYIFAQLSGGPDKKVVEGLQAVIHMYASFCIFLGVICGFLIRVDNKATQKIVADKKENSTLMADLMFIFKQPEVWLISLIISAGYHIFWSTYSFSAYLQEGSYGFTAVMAGVITTIKLWLRPIGGAGGGFLGDKFSNINVLLIALILAALGLVGLVLVPSLNLGAVSVYFLVFFILFVGLLTYAIRGLYWAIIEHLKVPESKLGLAIGVISILGYCPDIFIPLINGKIMDRYATQQQMGYQIYFSYTIAVVVIGIIACVILRSISKKKAS